jgi:hypothetical protein
MQNTLRKLIAAFVDTGLDYRDYLKPEIHSDFFNEFKKMYDEGLIIMDTSRPNYPFRIVPENSNVKKIDIDKYRKHWSHSNTGIKGYMGERSQCIKLLKDYWLKYPDHSYDQICQAAKEYVRQQVESDPKYLMTAENFIYKDGKSRLAAWVEDQEKTTRKVWI